MGATVYVQKKIEERASITAMLTSLQNQAADAGRDLTDPERKQFDELVERAGIVDTELERIQKFDASTAKFAELVGAQNEADEQRDRAHDREKREHNDRRGGELELSERAAYGKRFVESDAFKTYGGAGTSSRVELPGPASPEFRAAISLADFSELPAQMWAGPPGSVTRTPLLDVLGRVQTSQSAVLYLYWGTTDPAAAKVPEGELKPEAAMQPDPRTVALDTYAHYKAITRQALEDIAQIQTIVQNKLLGGVRNALEAAAAAALIADATIPTASGDSLLAAIRTGLATIEDDGYTANAIVLNPADAASLDLSAMGATVNGPVRNGAAWGVRLVPAAGVPAGSPYVGDFSQGLTWFDRGVTDVFMSDSHADFFLRNMLVVLAEARAAFAVTEPAALVKCSTPAEPAGFAE